MTDELNHEYPACAIFRGGRCTCDKGHGDHAMDDALKNLQPIIAQFKPIFEKQEFNRFKAAAVTGLLMRYDGMNLSAQYIAGQAHLIAVQCMADRSDALVTDRGVPA